MDFNGLIANPLVRYYKEVKMIRIANRGRDKMWFLRDTQGRRWLYGTHFMRTPILDIDFILPDNWRT